jgi:List-Bact-rpt repeat protein
MRHTPLLGFRPRYALLAALGLLVGVAAGALTARAHAGARVARSAGAGNWMAAVALPVPSPGDVSYGVARVRIGPGSRLSSPTGLSGQQTIFASRVGGLAIRAQAGSWRALRASTHVYVVVSAVPGAPRSIRDIAFFIVRRNVRAGPASAKVAFTIANARPQVGSFWVHGVNRRGYATVFAVRNILSTALANWSRYIHVLQLAHAISAAAHPLVLGAAPKASAAARGRTPGPWTGGQRADARVVAIYHLIAGELHDPYGYGALKKNPAITDFIANELGNPSLAARWSVITGKVPVTVPDRYAAAAQEERRFTHVLSPRISHAVVAINDQINSSGVWADHHGVGILWFQTLLVNSVGTGNGVINVFTLDGTRILTCSLSCSHAFPVTLDPALNVSELYLTEVPASGSVFSGWQGCVTPLPARPNACHVQFNGADLTIQGIFAPAQPTGSSFLLGVSVLSTVPGQTGTVTSSPAGIVACRSSCSTGFAPGTNVTLTPAPDAGSSFEYWTGCDSVSGNTCTVTMDRAKNVQANFV